ncbi:unnamed protein product [Mortierella alpina]
MSTPTTPFPEITATPVAPVKEADGDRAPPQDSSGSDSSEDASDQRLQANVPTVRAFSLTTENRGLKRAGIALYFRKQAPVMWSLHDYKITVEYTTHKDLNKKLSLFQSYLTSLKKIRKIKFFEELATSLLNAIIDPEALEVGSAGGTTGAMPVPEGPSVYKVLEKTDYLPAFEFSVAALEAEIRVAADHESLSRSESGCTLSSLPDLDELLQKVFGESRDLSWEKSLAIVRGLRMDVPLNKYLLGVFEHYERYFKYHGLVPDSINEREGWGNITWPIISGALDVFDVETRSFEVEIEGNGITRHFKENGVQCKIQADGVGLLGLTQVYVAEASQLLKAEAEKEREDFQKVVRAMGDLAIDHMETTVVTSPPPKTSVVYGSQSFKNRTRFFAMDVTPEFQLKLLDEEMVVPVTKAKFTSMMPACLRTALNFARAVSDETKKRRACMEAPAESLTASSTMSAAMPSLDLVSATANSSSALSTVQTIEVSLSSLTIVQATEKTSGTPLNLRAAEIEE